MNGPSPPDIAIIIVTHQRPAALFRLLDSVVLQISPRKSFEICVVDNGGDVPQDGSQARTVDIWLVPDENIGASAGRNRGVAATRAPLLLFLDDDGVLEGNALVAVRQAFEEDRGLMAARGRVLPLEHPFYNGIPRHYDRGVEPCSDWLIVEGITVIRRNAYEAVGGYDESLFGNEGIELSFRLLEWQPEARILYLPDLVLRHDFVNSLRELWQKGRRMALATRRGSGGAVEEAFAKYDRTHLFPDTRPARTRLFSWVPETLFRCALAYYKRRPPS